VGSNKDAVRQAKGKQWNYLTRRTSDSKRERWRIQVPWSTRGWPDQWREMKNKIRTEYFRRMKRILHSKLNGGNVISAINTWWAVSLVRDFGRAFSNRNYYRGCWFAATTVYKVGPGPEPWMMLAFTSATDEHCPAHRIRWLCSSKKFLTQLWILSGICSRAIFVIKVECLTVSKALVKSNEKTCMYWLSDSMVLGSRNSVCPPVCHTVTHTCFVTKPHALRIFWYHTQKGNHSNLLTPTVVGGRLPLLSEIWAQSDPPVRKTPSLTDFHL